MPLEKRFYIHSGKDGFLKDTTEADVRSLADDLAHAQKVLIHIHGGLVTEDVAMAKAERLQPFYVQSGVRPVFLIWESGFLQTITHNLHEIGQERIFAILVRKLLKYAVGKLTDAGGARASGQLQLPTEIEVGKEFNKRKTDRVPFDEIAPHPGMRDLTDAEQKRFEQDLATDPGFQTEVRAIVSGAVPEAEREPSLSKGVTALDRGSVKTLMSPEVIDELVADAAEKEGKGIFATAGLVIRVGKIFARVVRRFREKRDHGVYTTVVEELLRDLYLANVGAAIWGMMKKETADAFAGVGQSPARAGWSFIQELGRVLRAGHQPEISVVAHSAGAIYACHLLTHIHQARCGAAPSLPASFRLKNLIFLAPACTFDLFEEVLTSHRNAPLFESFRVFALNDEHERGYWEVPLVYPRSLLYFVSGVAETDGDKSAYDQPLLGMQRYHTRTEVYRQAPIAGARTFLARAPALTPIVWAVENRGPGLDSDATRHTAFDLTEDPHRSGELPRTMASIRYLLQGGA